MSKFTSVPAYSFGKEKDHFHLPEQPGPGAYDAWNGEKLVKANAPGYRMGKSQQKQRNNDNPGPGAYDAKGSGFQNKGGYMSGRPAIRQGMDIPGPGAYDTSPHTFSKKGARLGKAAKGLHMGSDIPGPGAYDPYTGNLFD